MKKNLVFFSGGILLLLLFLGLAAWYLYNKPHRGVSGERAAVVIPADSLYYFYELNEKEADKKFLGKILKVEGRLDGIEKQGQTEVWMLSVQKDGGGINCRMFAGSNNSPAKGSVVVVKGRCSGFLADVNLVDCEIEPR